MAVTSLSSTPRLTASQRGTHYENITRDNLHVSVVGSRESRASGAHCTRAGSRIEGTLDDKSRKKSRIESPIAECNFNTLEYISAHARANASRSRGSVTFRGRRTRATRKSRPQNYKYIMYYHIIYDNLREAASKDAEPIIIQRATHAASHAATRWHRWWLLN